VLSIAHQTVKDEFNPKIFCFNLAAPYVSEKYGKQLMEILPYIDILFGNECEAAAFAKMRDYKVCFMWCYCMWRALHNFRSL
jgi:adenosine kinase